MNRRNFLHTAVLSPFLNSRFLEAQAESTASRRVFEITTRVEIANPTGATRVWLPASLTVETLYQRTLSNRFEAPGGTVRMVESKADGLGIVTAEFGAGVKPVVTLTSRVETSDYSIAFHAPGKALKTRPAELDYFRRPTRLLPTDGIVAETAAEITRSARTDRDKAQAIYEWIVDNTFRNPKTRGCGVGDIRFMLESRDLSGKCADLNALYVGLARAAGLPARDVYGIRAAPSRLGYKSLGASSATITKAQHCRAEVYLEGYGWTPVDPADVRKVVLEEPPGNLPLDSEPVTKVRRRLFGSWEMNWIAYNFAHDVALPGARTSPIGFLMYPQAETESGRIDSLDPDNFRYEITAKEIPE